MIDSVNNNRGYYEYNKINTKTGAGMGSQEKFALGYDGTGTDSAKKEDSGAVHDTDGVVVEFSNQAKAGQEGMGSRAGGNAGAADAFDMEQTIESAKGFVGGLIKAVSGFLSGVRQAVVRFWNSDSGEVQDIRSGDVGEVQDIRPGNVGDIIESFEEEIQDIPGKDETVREAEELFANTRYARNSDLLTYYDRSGKYVQLSGTDKNRILHGDGKGGRLV